MSMTFTYDGDPDKPNSLNGVNRIICTWTSDSSGDASGTTKKIAGFLLRGITDPSASAAPTADYDITLADATYSTNLLAKAADDLTDRHTSTTEAVEFLLLDYAGTPLATSLRPCVCDQITVTVANAGNTKSGVLVLEWTPRSPG